MLSDVSALKTLETVVKYEVFAHAESARRPR
jgi:hypothetical protein